MKVILKETLPGIIQMGLGFISEVMEGDMKVNGNIIKCMDLVLFNGQTEGNMLGNMKMIRNMAMVNFFGLMEENIQDFGKTVNNMVEGIISVQTKLKEQVNGVKERELNG